MTITCRRPRTVRQIVARRGSTRSIVPSRRPCPARRDGNEPGRPPRPRGVRWCSRFSAAAGWHSGRLRPPRPRLRWTGPRTHSTLPAPGGSLIHVEGRREQRLAVGRVGRIGNPDRPLAAQLILADALAGGQILVVEGLGVELPRPIGMAQCAECGSYGIRCGPCVAYSQCLGKRAIHQEIRRRATYCHSMFVLGLGKTDPSLASLGADRLDVNRLTCSVRPNRMADWRECRAALLQPGVLPPLEVRGPGLEGERRRQVWLPERRRHGRAGGGACSAIRRASAPAAA